jgi:glyceraldehyde-3-phosphate dehydrogenase/erythrose-4-phosphate dehydrogenase
MSVKVAINVFGRIGGWSSGRFQNKDVEFVAVNVYH